ncbi:MAG: hypothetical protein V4591_01805 [Bdellovibrionota bacterium]
MMIDSISRSLVGTVRNFKTGDAHADASDDDDVAGPSSSGNTSSLSSIETKKNLQLDKAAKDAVAKFQSDYKPQIMRLREACEQFKLAEANFKSAKNADKEVNKSSFFFRQNPLVEAANTIFKEAQKTFKKAFTDEVSALAPAVKILLSNYHEESKKTGFFEFGPHSRGEAKFIAICYALIFGEIHGVIDSTAYGKRKINMERFETFYHAVTGSSLHALGKVKGYVEHGYFEKNSSSDMWEFFVSDESRHDHQLGKFIKPKDGGYGTVVKMYTQAELQTQMTAPMALEEVSIAAPLIALASTKKQLQKPLIQQVVKFARAKDLNSLSPREQSIVKMLKVGQSALQAAFLNRLCDRAEHGIEQFWSDLPAGELFTSNHITVKNKTVTVKPGVTVNELKNFIVCLNNELGMQPWFEAINDVVGENDQFVDNSPLPFLPDNFLGEAENERVGKILLSRLRLLGHDHAQIATDIVRSSVDDLGQWAFPMTVRPDGKAMAWSGGGMVEPRPKAKGEKRTYNFATVESNPAKEHAEENSRSLFTSHSQETLDKLDSEENQMSVHAFVNEVRNIVSNVLNEHDAKFNFIKPDGVNDVAWSVEKSLLLRIAKIEIEAKMWFGVDYSSKSKIMEKVLINLRNLICGGSFNVRVGFNEYHSCSISNFPQLECDIKIKLFQILLPDTWKSYNEKVNELKVFVGKFLMALDSRNMPGAWMESYVFTLPPIRPNQDDEALSILGIRTASLSLDMQGGDDARYFHATSLSEAVKGKMAVGSLEGKPGIKAVEHFVDFGGHSYSSFLVTAALAANDEKLQLPLTDNLEDYEQEAQSELESAKQRAGIRDMSNGGKTIISQELQDKIGKFFEEYKNLQMSMNELTDAA